MYAHLVCIANPYKVELCILLLFMVCWLCKWVKVLKLIEGGNKLIKTLASFRVYMSSLVSWRTLPPASFLYKTHTHRHTQLWRIAINEKFLKGFIRKQKYTNNHCCIKPLRPVFVVILLFLTKVILSPSLCLSLFINSLCMTTENCEYTVSVDLCVSRDAAGVDSLMQSAY